MKILNGVLALAFCLPILVNAQENQEEKSRNVELTYIKAKIGMESKFESAIKEHNSKFHKEGAYGSELYYVASGNEAGWYIWAMGVFTFTDLDSRPNNKSHNEDWDKTVAPFIADYGRVEYWSHNAKLSNRKEIDETMINIWFIDVKRGEYYRFNKFMEDVAAIYKNKEEPMNTYNNHFFQSDGRDVALVWPLMNWADLDKEDWKMKEEFDKMHGEGSWENGMEEWEDFVVDVRQELWRIVK